MGAEKNNSKANSQVLRDKLNQTLKQRLGKKTEAAKSLAEREPTPIESAEEPLAPRAVDGRGKPISRDRQFLDELESDAMHEIGLIDRVGMFSRELAPARPMPTAPMPPNTPNTPNTPAAPALAPMTTAEWPPKASGSDAAAARSLLSRPPPEAATPHRRFDAEGSPAMQEQEDHKNLDAQPSLMDLLKTSKPDGKSGSALKAPRQNNQSNAPEEDPEEPLAAPAKASFLKAPRSSKSQQAAHLAPDADDDILHEPSHEKEIVEAIKLGDKSWIQEHARLADVPPGRQEILLVFAFSKPECILALLSAGLKFDPKNGLAIRTALARKDYAALEALKARGATIDLDTLKAIASWRRTQNKEAASPGRGAAPAAPAVSPDRIQEDFDDFLRSHAEEIESDDLEAFTPSTPSSEQTVAESSTGTPVATSPALDPAPSFVDAFEEMQQTLHRLDDLEDPEDRAPAPSPTQPEPPEPSDEPALSTGFDEPDFPESTPGPIAATPLPPEAAEGSESPTIGLPLAPEPAASAAPTHASETPIMSQTALPEPRKTHAASAPGMSAMDRARLGMLDKVLLEKQQLEMKVMELQMFEEAAASLEEERDRLLDELAEAQDQQEQLAAQLAQARLDFSDFDSIKAGLEEELARQKDHSSHQEQTHRQEQDRLIQAEANLSSLLKDHERREAELRTHNAQLASKIAELETREAPAPEASDWLKDTDKEAALRKNLFIDTVIKGEHKLLDKVSKNTAVDSETAHWALVFAAEAGQLRCAQWIVDNLDAHPGFGGEIALLRALDSKNHDMVRWLAHNGSDIHHAEEFALRRAVDHDDVSMLDFLVSLGANPRVARERPLREAADKQSWSCFKALLGYGCTGYDDKGMLHPELAEQSEEAKPHLDWAAAQRKLARALDPDFAKRQVRREH